MTIEVSGAEAKRLFAEQMDEINRRSRRGGPDPEAGAELAEILAEHERECEALAREHRSADRRTAVVP